MMLYSMTTVSTFLATYLLTGSNRRLLLSTYRYDWVTVEPWATPRKELLSLTQI